MNDFAPIFEKCIEDFKRRVPTMLTGFISAEMSLEKAPQKRGKLKKSTLKNLRVDTGNLVRSFTKGQAGNITRDSARNVEIGTSVVYAAIHEFGGVINTRYATITMPARPYLAPAIAKFEEQALPALIEQVLQPLKDFKFE